MKHLKLFENWNSDKAVHINFFDEYSDEVEEQEMEEELETEENEKTLVDEEQETQD